MREQITDENHVRIVEFKEPQPAETSSVPLEPTNAIRLGVSLAYGINRDVRVKLSILPQPRWR
jgi:hypothetical protein